jgi:Tol biopolymer transport system component
MLLRSHNPAALLSQSAKAAVLQQLEKVLMSAEFARAERMRRFLRHAVEHTLANSLDELKESVIGVEVFDRSPSYNPKADPIVRIEARRLRTKLKEYYDGEGKEDIIRIDLPKGGYSASVEILNIISGREGASPGEPGSIAENPDSEELRRVLPTVMRQRRSMLRLRLSLVFLLILGVMAAAAFAFWRRAAREEQSRSPLAVRTFTSLPGAEIQPAFSADGSTVAYLWTGGEGGEPDIYVQKVDSFTPVRLTSGVVGPLSNPAWSPDGKEIAFLRYLGQNRFGLCVINVTTRFIRVLTQVEAAPFPIGPKIFLDWSPDGRYFVTTHRRQLVLISTSTGKLQPLTSAPSQTLGDFEGVFSPDGRKIAFRQTAGFGLDNLFVVPVSGGQPVQLTHRRSAISGHTWSADGKTVIFSAQRSLWRVSASGGEPWRITDGTVNALQPVASRAGGRLAFANPTSRIRTWRMPIGRPGEPEEILTSTRTDVSPDISPDGHRIAFRSDRTGTDEIWLSDSAGTHPTRLTRFGGPLTGCPRWSPDGREIAFDSRPVGKSDIFIVTVANGDVRQFTTEPSDEVVPSWSRDGRFLYFASMRTGDWQVWKQPLAGGPAIQITKSGGFASWESTNGKYVYYAKDRFGSGLWRVPAGGGKEEPVTAALEPGMWGNWRVGSNGILFAEAKSPFRLRSLDPETMRQRDVGRLPSEPMRGDAGMALSPDGAWLYVSLADPLAGDIFLVDHFQ